MLDDQETYKHLKTNPIASKTQDVNKFGNNLLESKKRSQKKKALD